MDNQLPFGYTRGQKRSYAQTEGDQGAASPAWYHDPHSNNPAAHDPLLQLHQRQHPPCHHAQPPPVHEGSNQLRFHLQQLGNPYSTSTTQTDPAGYDSGGPDFFNPHRFDDMSASPPRRFVGDGFDYRRPAGSAREGGTPAVDLSGDDDDLMHIDLSQDEGIIDLTADDSGYGASQDGNGGGAQGSGEGLDRNHRPDGGRRRLPRGMDIIIDLDNGDEEWRVGTPPIAAPGSPEIEFISARTIDPPPRQHQPGNPDGDEVEFVRANALPAAEIQRRRNEEMDRALSLIGDMHGRFTHLRTQVERFHVQVTRTAANLRRGPIAPPRGAARSRGHVHAGFAAPGLLDFQMVGFQMGNEEPDYPQAPPAPTYQAPPTAPEGFTRSPTEDEGPLICPNCEEELCVGEDEIKRQVWIVKACGHVYCGECTTNRATKRSAKGKERPPNTKPFKDCVVENCGKKVSSPRNMIQIFL
ncbi:hypothetical protein DE146DRAFT_667640 [Phaeosphaeria sp. MPI-PUGE-AT-0046c]|nr:hypothetical protein DE146DRAFT_667640 [Phaeosphaeria sp. MPI-PUGE-AT-0046c]